MSGLKSSASLKLIDNSLKVALIKGRTMRYGTLREQKGISLSGLLMWSVILVMLSILGMKLAPVYIQYASIQKALIGIASDPNIQSISSKQIRASFNKRARIDNIDAVSGHDIKIKKENGQRILEIDYSVTTPLVANISLFIEFNASSN